MIFVEDQSIKVNGVLLPGVIKSIEVKETAQIDEQEVEGSSTKPKQAVGYEDAKVNIELIIDDTETQTKYDRLALLRSIFRQPGQTVPQPIPIVCEDTAAHGVSTVLFKGLSHKAENKRGQIPVTLEFWEYIPQVIAAKKKGASGTAATSSSLTDNYQDYLKQSRGISARSKESPATDDARPAKSVPKIKALPFRGD